MSVCGGGVWFADLLINNISLAGKKNIELSKRKKRPSVTDGYRPKSSKSSGTRWGILIVLGIAIVAFIYSSIPKATPTVGPQFTKEGTLTISRDADEQLGSIDIEVADNQEDITQGLMYRKSMDEDQGMLFLLEDNDFQSFWMLNTYLPLDIIFIDEQRRIVNIRANTTPLSTDPVQSTGPARYVLEVNAGYAQRHGLQAGDQVDWQFD